MATTRTTIRSPGGIQSQGCFVSTVRDWALLSILPRLAVGGCTPMPRKLKDASSSMDSAMTEVAYTRMGATVLGSISENRICLAGIPATMLLLTKLVSRRLSTLPLTSRAMPGQSTNPRISMMLQSPGSKMAAATSTRSIYGKDMTMSVKRMMAMSSQPPKYPPSRPRLTPMAVDMAVASTPTSREIRVAYNKRENISRPIWSVPSRNPGPGGAPKGPAMASGS